MKFVNFTYILTFLLAQNAMAFDDLSLWTQRWGQYSATDSNSALFHDPRFFPDANVYVSAAISPIVPGTKVREVRADFMIPQHAIKSFQHVALFSSFDNGPLDPLDPVEPSFDRIGVAVFKDGIYIENTALNSSGQPYCETLGAPICFPSKETMVIEADRWYRLSVRTVRDRNNKLTVKAYIRDLTSRKRIRLSGQFEMPASYERSLRFFQGVMNTDAFAPEPLKSQLLIKNVITKAR